MSNRRQARMRAHARSVISHKEQSVNTNATQGPTEETPAGAAQPTTAADTQQPMEFKQPQSTEVSHIPRRRGYENDVDVTAQGSKPIVSLPVFGKIRYHPISVEDLDHAWVSLFNEHENGIKLINDLRELVIAPSELDLFLFEVRRREESEASSTPIYLITAYDQQDKNANRNVRPVAQYLVSTAFIQTNLVKMASPVIAKSVFKFAQEDDLLAKFKLTEEDEPARAVTVSEQVSSVGAPVQETAGSDKTKLAATLDGLSQGDIKLIEIPKTWLLSGELAHRWETIFNEFNFGRLVKSHLEHLEKRYGQMSMRILNPEARLYVIQVFRTADLPSMGWTDQAITKNGTMVPPIDTIRLFTTLVEGTEVVARMQMDDDYLMHEGADAASSDHAPKHSSEDVAAQNRRTAVIDLHPTDIRTFDANAFQQFVDQLRQANLSAQDAARLVAFMEFIAKCQQIEQTLFFHCTAYGRQLDMMLGAGKRHFPGAATPTPGSMFAPGARWGNLGDWGPKAMGQPQQGAPTQTYVQPNQTVSDVVISVFSATGTLLGVFQCAVPPVGYTVG